MKVVALLVGGIILEFAIALAVLIVFALHSCGVKVV
jgi:hypothetical protein